VIHLTKQEMAVLGVLISLLAIGLAVKSYRTAHPSASQTEQATH
jgi:hypothetical protein